MMTAVYTKYHGEKWAVLVEFGYVTISVDDNDIALMVKENKRKYPKLEESYVNSKNAEKD